MDMRSLTVGLSVAVMALAICSIIVFGISMTVASIPSVVDEEVSTTAMVEQATAHTPIYTTTSVQNATNSSAYNRTALYGANSTRIFTTITTPLRTNNATLHIVSNGTAGEYVNVSINGVYVGQIPNATAVDQNTVISFAPTYILSMSAVTFLSNVTSSLTNITNSTLNYTYWAPYTNYNTTTTGITTAGTGTYLLDYAYIDTTYLPYQVTVAAEQSFITLAGFFGIVLIALVGVYVIGLFGGGNK